MDHILGFTFSHDDMKKSCICDIAYYGEFCEKYFGADSESYAFVPPASLSSMSSVVVVDLRLLHHRLHGPRLLLLADPPREVQGCTHLTIPSRLQRNKDRFSKRLQGRNWKYFCTALSSPLNLSYLFVGLICFCESQHAPRVSSVP